MSFSVILNMLKLMDIYILKQFLSKFIATMISFISIFIIVDVIDHLDKFIDTEITRDEIFQYYMYTLPWYVSIGLPMSLLLATVFCRGLLQRRNELTAIKASGISLRRVSMSLLIFGFITSIFSFYFENILVAPSLHKRAEIEVEYFQKSRNKRKVKNQDIYLQVGKNQVLYIKRFDFKNNTAHNISLQKYDGNNISLRIDAPMMTWDDNSGKWRIPTYRTRSNLSPEFIKYGYSPSDTLIQMDFTPVDLTKQSVKPEEMNYWELKSFVERLRQNGILEPRWTVNLHFKPAFAFSSIIMVIFGLSLSVRKPRSSMAVGLGVSIFIIFLYYGAIKFGQSMGYKGEMDPLLSVWIGNIIFFTTGIFLFLKTRS